MVARSLIVDEVTCLDWVNEKDMVGGTSSGIIYQMKYDKEEKNYHFIKLGGGSISFNLGKPDDIIYSVQVACNASIFYIGRDSDLMQIYQDPDTQELKTKVYEKAGLKDKPKKAHGRMIKMNYMRDILFWKKNNRQIIKIYLEQNLKEPITIEHRDKDDFIVDFDLDKVNDAIYILTAKTKIFLKNFGRRGNDGIFCFGLETSGATITSRCLKISSDCCYMAICSFETVEGKGSYIHTHVYKINKDHPETPKVTTLHHKVPPKFIEMLSHQDNKPRYEFPQAADFSIKKNGYYYLSVFLRYTSKVLVYRLDEKEQFSLALEKRMHPEWLNSIASHGEGVYTCSVDKTIGMMYVNK